MKNGLNRNLFKPFQLVEKLVFRQGAAVEKGS